MKAGQLIGMVAQQVGGKGGGRPDMAQLVTDACGLTCSVSQCERLGQRASEQGVEACRGLASRYFALTLSTTIKSG
ncbi:hypothetical protein ACNKHV_16850 [Shigella flexneri]